MSDEKVVERELDHTQVLETKDNGTFVVIGVQEVTGFEGKTKQFNYMITRPENIIADEENTEEETE